MTELENTINELENVIADWQICEFCKIVDKDRGRNQTGHVCTACGEPSKGGQKYFNVSIHLIVDLIKEAFTTEHKIENVGTTLEYQLNTHFISVLIFFCTLREILLNTLIEDLCISQNVSESIYDRLISDNKLHIQKQDRLFKSLAGLKWADALKIAADDTGIDYPSLDKKIKELVGLRNAFLHKGDGAWKISEEVASGCIESIEPLVNIYVYLNNKYVHSSYIKK